MSSIMKAKRHCFAPRCRSGYHGHKKISLFKVPKGKVAEWSALIPKSDKKLTSTDTLCERHFSKNDIIRQVITETYSYPLNHPRLKENAVPCIWPDGVEAPKREKIGGSNEVEVFGEHFVFAECGENIPIKDEPLIFEENSVNDEFEPPSTTPDEDDDDESNLVIDESLIFEESDKNVPKNQTLALKQRTERDTSSLTQESSYKRLIFEDCDEKIPKNSASYQFWLDELFATLWQKTIKLNLPSESWTLKYYNNKIAIFKTSVFEDDIIITKKIILCKSFLKFCILQHVHHCLTRNSNNKISSVEEFEKVLVKFDKLSICYGLSVNEKVAIDFRNTWYCKDEILRSIRHKNCAFILNDKKRLHKSINWCSQCENAKKLVAYLKKGKVNAGAGVTSLEDSWKRDRDKVGGRREDENGNKEIQKIKK